MRDDSTDLEEARRDLMTRTAWLYHVEKLTQAEVATRLGLTRRAVNEMLAEALERGLVTVSVNGRQADCLALERALCEKFGLHEAVIAPAPIDTTQMHRVIGRVTAEYLGRMLPKMRPTTIGIGWGQTLRQTIQQMQRMKLPDTTVRSIIGGLSHGTEINTFETAHAFASKIGGQCRYFPAPVYADSPESRDLILAQPFFGQCIEKAREVDMALLSVGDAGDDSRLIRDALPPESGTSLRSIGAVGDLVCQFVDVDGQVIAHPANRMAMAIPLEKLTYIPFRVVTSGGAHKHDIMRAVARGGYANVIITDADCARAMLR